MTTQNDRIRAIPLLNPIVPMPVFSFFQLVKVKTTKEVGTIVGMWCVQTEETVLPMVVPLRRTHGAEYNLVAGTGTSQFRPQAQSLMAG